MTQTIQAVIFDMDGVLIDSDACWLAARQGFAQERGRSWTPEDQPHVLGLSTLDWARAMGERLGVAESPQAIADEILAGVLACLDSGVPLLPGAVEAVWLAAGRCRVALASGSPRPLIDRVLALTGLGDILDVALCGDEVPDGKPAPDIYLAAARQLGVEPAYCLGIEDSVNGIKAVKAAGMRVIIVANPAVKLPDGLRGPGDPLIESLVDFSLALLEG